MTIILDLDTGQVHGVVGGRDHKGVGGWLFARPLEWRLAVQVVAIDSSAAWRKALRMSLPRTAFTVDHFHLISIDKAWAQRMLLLRGGDNLSCRAALRLEEVFTWKFQPTPSRQSGKSRNSSVPCSAPGHWKTLRRQEGTRGTRNGSRKTGSQQALPHRAQVVKRDPGAHCHRGHDWQGRDQQHNC
ncbi:transposase [Arthrobacter sp. SAFR-044]|uniref:transposase n=1 Tax=Arthrobacter sp. SAFR-044 TaxID=3387278 RepID=UPI003F7B9099